MLSRDQQNDEIFSFPAGRQRRVIIYMYIYIYLYIYNINYFIKISYVTYISVVILWFNDAIWQHRAGSTLAWIMACCPAAPCHCLNHCWSRVSGVLWHWPDSNFTESALAVILYYEFENYTLTISATPPRGQWVKNHGKYNHRIISLYSSCRARWYDLPTLVLIETLPRFHFRNPL